MKATHLGRLAALLAVEPEALPAGVRALGEADLLALTDHVSDALHRRDRPRLEPIVNLVDRLPPPLVAKVAQERMAPRFVARLAGHLPPDAGAAVITRLEPAYLADVAEWAELPRCAALLAQIPPALVARAAAEFAVSQRWSAMARIAEHLPDASLAVALEALSDDAIASTIAHGRPQAGPRALGLLAPERQDGVAARIERASAA